MKKILLVLALSVIGGCSYPEPAPYQFSEYKSSTRLRGIRNLMSAGFTRSVGV
ncbi:MAG: hypothetical protein JXA81_03640 [Sedimentisphaerales bacterium]|nr:hypothetical protein [Sedimentisphaerales bacterium]